MLIQYDSTERAYRGLREFYTVQFGSRIVSQEAAGAIFGKMLP
jgi:hypothetical protein